MRILIVEDDKHLGWSIKTRMEKNGYVVDYETDGQSGLETAIACSYDLIILDIMLPKIDGFTVCREIRRKGVKAPILMLTARYREDDRVRGLDCGADDYLVKPFGYPELDARIRALIRRFYNQPSTEIDIGLLHIDISKKRVSYKGDAVTLTANEYSILEFLALNRNGVVTREMIQQHLWDMESSTFSNVIEVMVSRIRKKLDPDNKDAVIKTVKGLGYIIKDEKP
ncbi:MAG: response regulator transcription factor [Limnochordia bacterium]|jgi:DNA-binding response OmpR family regulator|nr:response regulator transcription factor [Limnochordia bacterium]